MHSEILVKSQKELLPLVRSFDDEFGLVGGTAIALHLGHRESLDFDLFRFTEFSSDEIRNKIEQYAKIESVQVDERDEFTVVVRGVKLTFLKYPYEIKYTEKFDDIIKLPDLLTLAAMKSFALGRRAKWKDYVDLYFILKDHHTLSEINKKAVEIFMTEYNEKIFRTQLAYFEDLNYTEEVIFRDGFEVSGDTIKKALIEFSLQE